MAEQDDKETAPCPACGSRDFEPLDAVAGLVRCRQCGLGRLEPQPSDEALAAVYTEDYYTRPIDPGGPSYIENREGLERFFDERLRSIERLVRPGRLLDVGAGLGYLLDAARRRGWRGVGLETSEFAVRHARREFGLDVRQQTLDDAALDDAAFDLVVMRDVLEHTRHPRAALARAHRLLRPGGVLALSVPNFGSLNARLGGPHWRHLRLPQHLFHFTPEALERLLRESGFRVAELASRYDSPATREVYAALAEPGARRRLAAHAALRGDIVFLPIGSNLRRALRAAAVVCSCIARPLRGKLKDDILEALCIKPEASR